MMEFEGIMEGRMGGDRLHGIGADDGGHRELERQDH
jgi:hypothetical protein